MIKEDKEINRHKLSRLSCFRESDHEELNKLL